jgi:NAD(P)-dependent dehydrogenase (short-subunit alcohol dehydrogenase family)
MTTHARVALVTGASAGLGRACADRLAADGWTVVGASRRGTGASNWAGLVMNVDSDETVRAGVDSILSEHGRIDALVAAAGWGVAGAAEDTSIEEGKAQFETNFWGCVRVVNAVLPQMRGRGRGRIVLLSSIGGVIGIPFQALYSASKFALEGYAESLGYEIAPFGVTVTLVQPGNFATDFTASRQTAAAATPQSAYAAAMTRAVSAMERDERNGARPAQVAAVVQRVLDSARPPRRVSVGKASERTGIIAKRLLPFRLFEAAAKSSLGV